MNVIMVGGPDDGKEFKIKDGSHYITITLPPPYPNLIHKEIYEPLEEITTKNVNLPIKLTRNGYRVYWPY